MLNNNLNLSAKDLDNKIIELFETCETINECDASIILNGESNVYAEIFYDWNNHKVLKEYQFDNLCKSLKKNNTTYLNYLFLFELWNSTWMGCHDPSIHSVKFLRSLSDDVYSTNLFGSSILSEVLIDLYGIYNFHDYTVLTIVTKNALVYMAESDCKCFDSIKSTTNEFIENISTMYNVQLYNQHIYKSFSHYSMPKIHNDNTKIIINNLFNNFIIDNFSNMFNDFESRFNEITNILDEPLVTIKYYNNLMKDTLLEILQNSFANGQVLESYEVSDILTKNNYDDVVIEDIKEKFDYFLDNELFSCDDSLRTDVINKFIELLCNDKFSPLVERILQCIFNYKINELVVNLTMDIFNSVNNINIDYDDNECDYDSISNKVESVYFEYFYNIYNIIFNHTLKHIVYGE